MGLFTCGTQNYDSNCTDVPLSSKGEIIFRAQDPTSSRDQYFPISAGKYVACLMDDNDVNGDDDGNDQIGQCKVFKVSPIVKKKLKKSKVTLTKNTFKDGDPIEVKFKG